MKDLFIVQLTNVPIYQQLQIEEGLLRADDRNWCIINSGSPSAIVMGISAKYNQLINLNLWKSKPVPIVRRFSGGGTVFVDEHTCFYTIIGNNDVLDAPCYPDKLLAWTEKLYKPAFKNLDFKLRENDYVIGNKKF